jgi:hypothetical protein
MAFSQIEGLAYKRRLRRDMKWHSYEPMPEVESIDAFFKLVAADAHACFFG